MKIRHELSKVSGLPLQPIKSLDAPKILKLSRMQTGKLISSNIRCLVKTVLVAQDAQPESHVAVMQYIGAKVTIRGVT